MVALLSDCHISTYVDDIKKDNEANQSSHKVLTDLQSLQSTSVGIEINSQLFFQTSLLLRKPLGIYAKSFDTLVTGHNLSPKWRRGGVRGSELCFNKI